MNARPPPGRAGPAGPAAPPAGPLAPIAPGALPSPGGPLAGFGTIFAWGLFRVVRWTRVGLVALAAGAIGGWIGWEAGRQPRPAETLATFLDGEVLGFGLPLIALLLAAEGFAREVSGKTLVYHLVRPVPRATLFVARFLAGFVPAALVGTGFLVAVVLASGVPVPHAQWASLALTASMAALGLGAVLFVLATLLRHGLVAGLLYAFVVEALVASVPGTMQKYSVMFHVRSLHHGLTAGWLPEALPDADGAGILTLLRVDYSPPGEAALVLALTAAAILAFGAWRVTVRDWSL